ncbi:hypothetical protein ACTFIW_000945 [Dictyostelium discoideum]
MPRNQLTQVVITLQETVVIVNPVVGVMADLTTSMDHQVMLHQVATIPSLQTVPTTVFRRTRSKLTSRWTSVPPQTSLERIGSSKLLSRGRKWIKSPSTFKLQADAQTQFRPKSDCITKEVQDLLLDDAIEQVLPNRYSKRVFYSNVFTVPKPGTTLHRPVLDLKRLNTYINNQSFKMEGIKNLPSMVKQGYYMVKLDIKKAYLHVLVDPQYRDLFRFVWKGSHYRWKTMPFGLSTAPHIFTMLLRPVLRILRDINVFVIAYLDDLLIVGSTHPISNLVSDDSSTSSSSSSSHVSSSTGYIPRSIDKTISRVNTNPNSTTLETGDYSTFQSHVMSIIRIQKSSTAELLMKSWEPSTLKVYSSSYTRFRNFCTLNSLNPANITFVVFMNYLTHLFKHKPPLAFSTINGHRSMLNQLLLLKNQTDIVNDPFITRIMTGIHKLRPSSAKYQEIWDANQVFKHLSTIKVIPKYTYTALLKKTLVLCKMFGLARSSDLVKWSFNGLIITPNSIKGPVINAKEQRKGVLSILELTSLDDTNSQVCPVRHLSTYLRASKERRKPHSGDSVFIQNEGKPLDVKEINIIVLSTLSSSGIDISKFKSHSTRSAMASLLLSNNVPFHVVKKMDKRIIGEKSGGFLNTVVQIS